MSPKTPQPLPGKEESLALLRERRSDPPEHIDNASLHAGSPMYYYCKSCGWLADVKNEGWSLIQPRTLCAFCQRLRDCGWLE